MTSEELENVLSPDMISDVLRSNDSEMLDLVLNYILLQTKKDTNEFFTDGIIENLLAVAEDFNDSTSQLILDAMINISGNVYGTKCVLGNGCSNLQRLLNFILKKDSVLANQSCKILANVSRYEEMATELGDNLLKKQDFSILVDIICNQSFNNKGQKMEYMTQVFGNLCQSNAIQKCITDPVNNYLPRILPVLHMGKTTVERYGIASIIYNCLFDRTSHMTLLQPPFEILPVLLYPLAGPEVFDDEDYEKMPLDLQYLPEDKTREEDPHIRNLLLRSLLLLCDNKPSRCFIRDHNSYFILREYHKWEKDKSNLLAAENVIDVLIRTEVEIGVDNLSSVSVPDDLKEKFDKWDKDFISDN